jgi:hypothetical protein
MRCADGKVQSLHRRKRRQVGWARTKSQDSTPRQEEETRGKNGGAGRGAGSLVYVGSVHGRHVIVRLVQCLGSFVHLGNKRNRSKITWREAVG